MRRLSSGVAGLVVVWAASAAVASLGPHYGGSLRVGVPGEPVRARPAAPPGAGSRLVQRAVHATLVGIGPDGLPEPALARAWSSAAGGREWSLLLRDGLRFHDGRALGTEDAVRSLRAFLRDRASAAAGVLASDLEGGLAFRAGDSDELRGLGLEAGRLVLRLRERRHRPFAALSSTAAAIVGPTGAGCGPFVPSAPRPGPGGWQLSAFAGHWRGRPFLDTLALRFGDGDGLRADRRAGRLDVAPSPGGAPSAATVLLQLEPGHPVLAAHHARRAIAESIDRQGLAAFAEAAAPAAALLPPLVLPPLPGIPPHDPGGARFTGRLRFTVDRAVPEAVSQRVVAHLSTLGFDVDVNPVASQEAWTGPADARLVLWLPEVPEARVALVELASHLRSSGELLELVSAAEAAPDEDRRRAGMQLAHETAMGRHELVPLLEVSVGFEAGDDVQGLRVGLDGALVVEDAWTRP